MEQSWSAPPSITYGCCRPTKQCQALLSVSTMWSGKVYSWNCWDEPLSQLIMVACLPWVHRKQHRGECCSYLYMRCSRATHKQFKHMHEWGSASSHSMPASFSFFLQRSISWHCEVMGLQLHWGQTSDDKPQSELAHTSVLLSEDVPSICSCRLLQSDFWTSSILETRNQLSLD